MPQREPIREIIAIRAPLDRCWALSTRVELVQKTLGMKLVGGVTHGFVTAGSRVIWGGWKFCLPTQHHTLITQFEPPHAGRVGDLAAEFDDQRVAWFEDTQEKGRFAEFHHLHLFRQEDQDVGLEDVVHFRLPFGFLGEFVAARIMAPYIRKLTRKRFAMLKELAESEGWRAWVEGDGATATRG